jgi:aconitate hydratase
MIKLYENGVYLVNGSEIIENNSDAPAAVKAKTGIADIKKEDARQGTMAYEILKSHNTSGLM